MLDHIARLVIKAPKRVLAAAAFLTLICAGFGSTVAQHLVAGGYQDPNSESARASGLLAEHFQQGDMDLTLLVKTPDGVFDPATAQAGQRLAAQVAASAHVTALSSPWTVPPSAAKALISKDGKSALVVAGISGGETDALQHAKAIADRVGGTHEGLTILPGGISMLNVQVNEQSEKDLLLAESIAVPLSFLVLVWIFGGLIAASLPLIVGGIAIAATLAELRLIAVFANVSTFALNLTTAMALGLAIDYTLLLVSRYREEAGKQGERDAALAVAVRTAGRTVLFSSVTVLLAVCALALFPMYFLRSMAYAGIGVVLIAAISAVLVAPALLKLLGDRVDALDLRAALRSRPEAGDPTQSMWYKSTKLVMRFALPSATVALVVLFVLWAPFLGARFGFPDDRVLPTSATDRQVGDALRADFPENPEYAVSIILKDAGSVADQALSGYADALSAVPGVRWVNAPDGAHVAGSPAGPPLSGAGRQGALAWLTASLGAPPYSDSARHQLTALHAVPAPGSASVLFTGQEELNEDSVQSILSILPWSLTLIAVTSFVLLFLLTGSVVLAVKALVLNTVSLTASLGALVWVFQDGHLGALGTTATGWLTMDVVVFMALIAFGLSMDYEVFIVSRIREHWLASERTRADNEESVALGVATSGRVVTAAALLMSIVFAAMISGQVSFMRLMGLGLTLAVVVDATLVRMVLVPAFMKLAGKWNWWAPKPLARLHEKIGLSES